MSASTVPLDDVLAELEADLLIQNPDVAHAICQLCFPHPRPADILRAVCGWEWQWSGRLCPWGSWPKTCDICDDLSDTVRLPCGHPGERCF